MLIAVGASAVLGLSFYLKRRTKKLQAKNQALFNPPSPSEYRGLFAPTDEELRQIEREKLAAEQAKEAEILRQESEEKLAAITNFKNAWLVQPDRKNTIELLRRAAESASSEKFSEIASAIVELWREGKIKDLPARDLADLLDSHLRILPQQERTSGALFWLKEEIAEMRRKSEESE